MKKHSRKIIRLFLIIALVLVIPLAVYAITKLNLDFRNRASDDVTTTDNEVTTANDVNSLSSSSYGKILFFDDFDWDEKNRWEFVGNVKNGASAFIANNNTYHIKQPLKLCFTYAIAPPASLSHYEMEVDAKLALTGKDLEAGFGFIFEASCNVNHCQRSGMGSFSQFYVYPQSGKWILKESWAWNQSGTIAKLKGFGNARLPLKLKIERNTAKATTKVYYSIGSGWSLIVSTTSFIGKKTRVGLSLVTSKASTTIHPGEVEFDNFIVRDLGK